MNERSWTARWSDRLLAVIAVLTFLLTVGAIVWSAGTTLGYDFQAYSEAAGRLLKGERLYDPGVDVAGGFAIYLYPPPFALAVTPYALLAEPVATLAWTATLLVAFLAGVALMPVRPMVRWAVILLASIDWPFLYSIKLGQVGPILFLLFAAGWRWIGRPSHLGSAIGLGALVKLQPILLLGWAGLLGKWRAIGVAAVVIVAAGLASVVVGGVQPWIDYPAILGRVSSPLTTPHNFTPGAIAFQHGAGATVAGAIQVATLALVGVVVLVTTRRRELTASYQIAVVGSQLASPLLWDHYAMLLLLPVAWLLDRGRWWAALVPVATSIALVGVMPSWIYPLVFGICLIAPLAFGAPTHAGDPAPDEGG